MGGDLGPSAVVPGAVDGLRDGAGFALALYGDEAVLAPLLAAQEPGDLPVSIVHCTQTIEMGESPATAVRGKPDSPIVKAMKAHREGAVQAVFSAGSTGAMVAASLMILGRLDGVDRPAIATVIPTLDGRFLLLDAGANVQCTAEQLLTFGTLGKEYARQVLDIAEPTVGLLNIGEEPTKGNDLCIEAHALFAAREPAFLGNVESRHLLRRPADVVITDGFTGNMVLKLIEGFGAFLKDAAGRFASADAGGSGLGGLLKRMDYAATGGAPLLGVRGSSIIGHGSSSAYAVHNAVLVAGRMAVLGLPARLQEQLDSSR
jgi:glycerol-3-phosphate acyltransferase PlsX